MFVKSLQATILFLSLVLLFSCSKQKQFSLVGEWESVSFYQPDAAGVFQPVQPFNFSETISFESVGRFIITTDVPPRTGEYQWHPTSADVLLKFEADNYGNPARTETRTVEELGSTSLLIVQADGNGVPRMKTLYRRIR